MDNMYFFILKYLGYELNALSLLRYGQQVLEKMVHTNCAYTIAWHIQHSTVRIFNTNKITQSNSQKAQVYLGGGQVK